MIGVIIQARMGSTRLPGKVLKSIGDKPLLGQILFRLQSLNHEAKIVVATSKNRKDDAIEAYCHEMNVSCFRGSELNVLERYYLCAKKHHFKHIVRLTADNPFVDIEELDNLLELHLASGADYSRSFKALPVGVGTEVFTYNALSMSFGRGTKTNHLEHVNEYIEENEDQFNISELNVVPDKNRHDIRLTVDTPEDYERANFIARGSRSEYISTQEAIALCLQYV